MSGWARAATSSADDRLQLLDGLVATMMMTVCRRFRLTVVSAASRYVQASRPATSSSTTAWQVCGGGMMISSGLRFLRDAWPPVHSVRVESRARLLMVAWCACAAARLLRLSYSLSPSSSSSPSLSRYAGRRCGRPGPRTTDAGPAARRAAHPNTAARPIVGRGAPAVGIAAMIRLRLRRRGFLRAGGAP
eukprot:COSAG01_NODE_530_length_15875_cov_27.779982_4_plen_190_part_00